MEYEKYEQSSAPEKVTMEDKAIGRLHNHLQQGPLFVDTESLFNDVYLLQKIGFFSKNFKEASDVMKLAGHPRVRGDFVNRLKEQDAAGNSKEVLATLAAGSSFDYWREIPFTTVHDKLVIKHKQLIQEEAERKAAEEARRRAEEARQRAEEAKRRAEEARQAEQKKREEEAKGRAEEAKKRAEAEAKRTAKKAWPPPESNLGKSPEWVAAGEKAARLWAEKSRSLPQGPVRETEGADIAYFHAGFNLLKDEIKNGSPSSLELRAMLEYLIPKIGRTPRTFERFFKKMQKEEPRSSANLSELGNLAKGYFIPLPLQVLRLPPNKEQAKQIRSVFRALQKSMHPDIAGNFKDASKGLVEFVDIVCKSFNNSWVPVNKLLK